MGEKSAAGLIRFKLHSLVQQSFVKDYFCKCKKISLNEILKNGYTRN